MADDARCFEVSASGASAAARLGSNTRGEIEMLAPLALDAVIMLITCALVFRIGWTRDNDRVEIEAGQSRRAVLEIVTEGRSADRAGRFAHIEAPNSSPSAFPWASPRSTRPTKLPSKSLSRMIGVGLFF